MPRTALAVLIILTALLATMTGARAQDASPAAEPATAMSGGCDVAPRSQDELASLNATASAGSATPAASAASPVDLPEGDAVDADTLNALDQTLTQVSACAKSGDLARLLALYSDRFAVEVALAPEPVAIVPGQPSEGEPGALGTPVPATATPMRVQEAVRLADGRIAARVSGAGLAGADAIVFFVQERGRWVIDEIRPALPKGPIGGDLPFPVQAAVAAAAAELAIDASQVTVVSWEPKDWGDTSLGCPKPGEVYAQVITPGYLVILSANGKQLEYHTDDIDRAVHCNQS